MFKHGLDRNAASYTSTVLFILLLLALVYLIRETLFVFALALLFSYLLWPLVHCIDRRLPGRSRVPALAIVYSSMVGLLIIVGITVGSRVVLQADALALRIPELLSRLEKPAEQVVFEALDRLMEGKTCIVIAHHLATIRHAKMIFVVKDNNIVERGTHDELLAAGGFYAELYDIQFRGEKSSEARAD